MESPIEVVRRFCAAWSDNMGAVELAAFFAEGRRLTTTSQQEPVTGRENIANTIASVLRPWPAGHRGHRFSASSNIAANGPVVMTERVDRLQAPRQVVRAGRSWAPFEVSGGKIQRLAGLFST